jgi:hypothetical protein
MRAAAAVLRSLCPTIPEEWCHLWELEAAEPEPKQDNGVIVAALSAFRDFLRAQGPVPPGVDWSQPDTVARWAKVWGVSPRTMGKMLRTRKVRCQKLNRQAYQVAVDDIPAAHRRRFQQAP